MFFISDAMAADPEIYARAIDLVDERYLWPARVTHALMFRAAAREASEQVDWLLATDTEAGVRLVSGDGSWSAELPFTGDLPADLARLEDAIAGAPLGTTADLRVVLLSGLLDPLDRHSVVLSADSLARFDERLSGTLTGIGITISRHDQGILVESVFPHGPAMEGGLRAGDLLVEIDGVATRGMRTADATAHLRGAAGSTVRVRLLRGEQDLSVELTRRELSVPNVHARVDDHGVGFVTIDHFSERTTAWLQESLDALADDGVLARGLVLDLRGNTGGSLPQSARAADTFLQHGLLVRTAGHDGGHVPGLVQRIDAKADYPPYAMPLAVLMDPSTASGSEILAGALAQLDRAILIGELSFGKGTVQTLYPLDDGVKLKLTVAEWILAGDRHVAGAGLPPDVGIVKWKLGRPGGWYPAPQAGAPRLQVYDLEESEGWGDGRAEADLDVAALVASEVTRAATGIDRDALLAAADRVVPALAATQEQRLLASLAEAGIDWSAAPGPVGAPAVEVDLRIEGEARAGEAVEVVATVRNAGPELHRAAIRLRATDPLWEDLVFLVGRLGPGETTEARARVEPDADRAARADEVELRLECDGCVPQKAGRSVLEVGGGADPIVALEARLVRGEAPRLLVDATASAPAEAVRFELGFPGVPGVHLGERPAPVDLPARRTVRVEIPVALEAEAPASIPLELSVRSEDFGTIERASFSLEPDGPAWQGEAPTLRVRPLPTRAGVGELRLSAQASDEDGLDHLVVWAGPDQVDRKRREPALEWKRRKLAWIPLSGRRGEGAVVVPLLAGSNHIRVVAVDRDGMKTSQDLYVWASPEAAIAAESDR